MNLPGSPVRVQLATTATTSVGKGCPTARQIGKRPPGSRPLRLLLLEQPSAYRQIPCWFIHGGDEILIIWGHRCAQDA